MAILPDHVPLTQINELAKIHCESYASPHSIKISAEGIRHIVLEIMNQDASRFQHRLWKAKIAYYAEVTLKPSYKWVIVASTSIDGALLRAEEAANQFKEFGSKHHSIEVLEMATINTPFNITDTIPMVMEAPCESS